MASRPEKQKHVIRPGGVRLHVSYAFRLYIHTYDEQDVPEAEHGRYPWVKGSCCQGSRQGMFLDVVY
jgi:hypothetical protein